MRSVTSEGSKLKNTIQTQQPTKGLTTIRIKIYLIPLSLLYTSVSLAGSPDWQNRLDLDTAPMVFNVAQLSVQPDVLKKAAIVAMVRRKWKIQTIEDALIIGKYASAKVMINFESADKITIGYLKHFNAQDKGWLLNLKKDMQYETARCGDFK